MSLRPTRPAAHRAARRVVGLVVAAALVLPAGCGRVPSRPDEAGWRETAATAVDDALAQLGTAALVLEQDQDGRLWGGFGVATLVHAEEAMGSAVDSLHGVQPPPGLAPESARVLQLLGDADDLVRRARVAVVAEDDRAYPLILTDLRELQRALDETGGRR